MSEDQSSRRKEKKAQRDAKRQRKSKNGKSDGLREPEEGVGKNDAEQDFIPLDAPHDHDDNTEAADTGSTVKSTPRKRKANSEEEDAVSAKESAAPKPKRRKKGDSAAAQGESEEGTDHGTKPTGKHRFILFVGNLPYSTTDASLHEHFKSLAPFNLRHRTDPKTNKSKGFAFLEFENYDRMKTCLKLYHHSMFNPTKQDLHSGEDKAKGNKKDREGRRINVELTAGGGGKAEGRKEKIKAKNVRLEDQRKRRSELEQKEKAKRQSQTSSNNEGSKVDEKTTDAPPVHVNDDAGDIHPSRLARITQ